MSGSALKLTVILLLFCIQSTRQSVCPTSCCECRLGGQEIQCKGAEQLPEPCDVPKVLQKLELDNFNNSRLSNNFKQVLEIEYLIVKDSPISILSDLINGQKSLKRLKLIAVTIISDWEWGPVFAQFNNLTDFHLKGTHLLSDELIINGSADMTDTSAANTMISFSVNDCDIKSIKSDIIKKWIHLKMISLAHNCIHELDRDWLPKQLESLWSLDLSYNNISTIPEKYFSGMTSLRKLRLDNNNLRTLHNQWFRPIWEDLHELWLNPNKIQCSSDLAWVTKVMHPTFFDETTCLIKGDNKVVYFHKLRDGDAEIMTPP